MLTFQDKNSKMGLVDPETAALKALEVPVETRVAAVEHVVDPVEPIAVTTGITTKASATRVHWWLWGEGHQPRNNQICKPTIPFDTLVTGMVEPAVAPVDKDSSPSEAPEAPEALSFSRALPFLLAALPRYHI